MLRANFNLSTPFRLALSFVALSSVTYFIAGFIVYDSSKREIAEIYDHRVAQLFQVLSGNNEQDLIKSITQRIAVDRSRDTILLLATQDGKFIVGNMPVIRSKTGVSVITGDELGFNQDYQYRLLEGIVNGNRLVVGVSNAEIDELGEVLLNSFGWALFVAAALAATGAISVAIRAKRRLNALNETMEQVSAGDLTARIPLLGNNDDIDLISAKVNAALEHLSVAVEGLRQVSSDIAHDLKTPLNRLKIIIEAALDKSEKGINVEGELEAAARESDQINETFSALLRIAQIESGARKSRFSLVDVTEVLEKTADIYVDVASDAGMKLKCVSTQLEKAEIFGDRELLTQLFANLFENAIRHCPVNTQIEYFMVLGQNTVTVSIMDDGPGIPEPERKVVLRRLYRLEKSRTTAGSGLGLSMVKAIVDLHDAELSLEDHQPGLAVAVKFPKINPE
ncbi:HAMP domain-containing sensor histidine kinase [uncultured Sneathiella sp.]|uniref:sensor histidine kinase n=1 Tax=uncultured Sneathiella sp. TaxID=879315 RepID=UPI0030EF75F1|tara:strand:+ start:13389 stop:14744 length:1356 start_codon:yes stop_codon:yes gene_type:complete